MRISKDDKWRPIIFITAFSILKLEMLSAQKQVRVLRVEVSPEVFKRANQMDMRSLMNSAQNIFPVDSGSVRPDSLLLRGLDQQNMDYERQQMMLEGVDQQGMMFDRKRQMGSFGQLLADLLPDHLRSQANSQGQQMESILPDHLRHQNNGQNQDQIITERNGQQTPLPSPPSSSINNGRMQETVTNEPTISPFEIRNFPSQNSQIASPISQGLDMDQRMMQDAAMIRADLQQMAMNREILSPFDGFYPGLYPMSPDADIENPPLMITPGPQLMSLAMRSFMQDQQNPKRRERKLIDEALSNPIETIESNVQLTPPSDMKIQQVPNAKRTSLNRQKNGRLNRLAEEPKPIVRTETKQSPLPEIIVQSVTKSGDKTSVSKQANNKITDAMPSPSIDTWKKTKKQSKTKKNTARKETLQINNPASSRVVQVQIESNRPGLTKGVLMDLLKSPAIQMVNNQRNNRPASLLSILSGQHESGSQFTVDVPRHQFTNPSRQDVFFAGLNDRQDVAGQAFLPGIPIPSFINEFPAQSFEPQRDIDKLMVNERLSTFTQTDTNAALPPVTPVNGNIDRTQPFMSAVPSNGLFQDSWIGVSAQNEPFHNVQGNVQTSASMSKFVPGALIPMNSKTRGTMTFDISNAKKTVGSDTAVRRISGSQLEQQISANKPSKSSQSSKTKQTQSKLGAVDQPPKAVTKNNKKTGVVQVEKIVKDTQTHVKVEEKTIVKDTQTRVKSKDKHAEEKHNKKSSDRKKKRKSRRKSKRRKSKKSKKSSGTNSKHNEKLTH